MEIINGITWDVGPKDDITCFDPELSYWVTKYRPINKIKGLDFDPSWFTQDAIKKESEGQYSGLVTGSKSQRDFWKERYRRSIHGYESHGYRLSGDNYFFLNFYRMKISEEGDIAGKGRTMGFPQFFVYQYEYFHYVEMCEILGFDVGLLKSRGIGFSEIGASLCARPFITTPDYRVMASAFSDRHLKPLLAKIWIQLDWLSAETETAFRRERMAVNTTIHKRASLKEKDGREFGHMSEIEGVVADFAWKIRGDRTERLFFEEAGSDKIFEKKWTQGEALVTTMGRKIGTRIGWGCVCAGTKVLTANGKSVNVEELKQEDGIIGYDGNTISKEPIIWMKPPEKKQCVKITVEGGRSIECSTDHPFLTNNDKACRTSTTFKLANELKEKDKLMLLPETPIFGNKEIEDARTLGLMVGDGCCLNSRLSCDPEIYAYIKSNYDTSIRKEFVTKDGWVYRDIYIKQFNDVLRSAGIFELTGQNKTLPTNIHEYNKNSLAELLAGYYDADGSVKVYKQDNIRITLTSASITLLQEVQIQLSKFGIYSIISTEYRKGGFKEGVIYRLNIEREDSVKLFADNIKFLNKHKQERLDLINASNRVPKRSRKPKNLKFKISENNKGSYFENKMTNNIMPCTIISIEDIGEKEIYNLNAGTTHTYLANGFITANTGGDEGASIEGIRKMTTDPDSFNILPFVNRHTLDGEPMYTAMFIPAYVALFPHRDKRGWIDPINGREFYDKERKKRENNPKGLLLYIAEYCYTIEEALSGEGDNIFPREQLAEQKTQLEIYKKKVNIETGWLTQKLDKNSNPTGELKWDKSPNGRIIILEHPIKSESGIPYNNLYVGGIDAIDIGKKDSATTNQNKLSDFCVVIKKRVHGLAEPRYVAMYKHRPEDPRTAYDITAKMLMYYNAKAVLEATRTAILTHFRNKKYMYLLMKRPRSTMPNVTKGNPNMYGTPTPRKVIDHYLELIYEYVLDYSHQIDLIEMVDQLLNYSDEFKGRFDIIAAMGMAELGDEELAAKAPREKEEIKNQFRDIGYFKDSNGRKQYGIIPQTEDERYEKTRIRTRDSWLHQELV